VASTSLPPIGARLRAARHRRGVSVRGLAREIGVSASLISQIETDKSSPSVSTLYAISTALGLSLEELFSDAVADDLSQPELDDDSDEPVPPVDGFAAAGPAVALALRAAAPGLTASGSFARRRLGPLVTPEHRELLTLDSGVTWELLGQIPGVHVDFLLITYQPGGTSSGSGLLMRHSGTEFGYVISGELTLTLGFDTHRLTAGDSISFDSVTPHAYRNESAEPAVGVWFVLEEAA
jgi:transcriptional regulator with XRE-family HTH domain